MSPSSPPLDRKAATLAWKERKPEAAVFAIHCRAAGLVWVGGTATPEALQRRVWFTLSTGSAPKPEMQAAWAAHGPDGFAFEILERIDEENDLARAEALKARRGHWLAQLGAKPA